MIIIGEKKEKLILKSAVLSKIKFYLTITIIHLELSTIDN